jgi:hypothetical protein
MRMKAEFVFRDVPDSRTVADDIKSRTDWRE